jgi:ribonucleoside-diphosphate reductase alpha chain
MKDDAVPSRRYLPDTRRALTHKFAVAGHEGYLTVGFFDDGSPGELFIAMAKEGSTIGGLMDSLGILTSIALQYGVPLEVLVEKFSHQRFEPSGFTSNPDIKTTSSIVDYIFRWLAILVKSKDKIKSPPAPEAPVKQTKPVVSSDAPICPHCGSSTVRSGACHRCPNCGESLGCS